MRAKWSARRDSTGEDVVQDALVKLGMVVICAAEAVGHPEGVYSDCDITGAGFFAPPPTA